MDEVSNALWYLEDRLLEAEWRVRERLIQAFEDEFGCGLAAVTPLTRGSGVGGDRDGNPFVTAEITLAAARSARRSVLGHYGRALADLTARLSVSERLAAMSPELRASLERDRQELPGVWEQNRRRNADEPLRLKVSFMRARVEADPCGCFGSYARSRTRSAWPRPRPTLSRARGPPTTCCACCSWRGKEGSWTCPASLRCRASTSCRCSRPWRISSRPRSWCVHCSAIRSGSDTSPPAGGTRR